MRDTGIDRNHQIQIHHERSGFGEVGERTGEIDGLEGCRHVGELRLGCALLQREPCNGIKLAERRQICETH
jgi:hypothetical protein